VIYYTTKFVLNADLSDIIKTKSITPISTGGGADSAWKDIIYNFSTAYEDASKLMFVASGVGTYNGANGVYFVSSSLTTTSIKFSTYNVSTIKGFIIELY